MKFTNMFLMTPFIFTSMVALASEGSLQYREYNSHAPRSIHNLPKEATKSLHSTYSPKVASSGKNEASKEMLERFQKYIRGGMSSSEALSKAIIEVQEAKELLLEKELRSLGCVQWHEIPVITPHIFQSVKEIYEPKNGPFILEPGLRIRYLNDK